MTELLSHETRGRGPGLVLVHGTGSTGMGSWGTVIEELASRYTVVLPNLPGSGDSSLPNGPLNIDVIADQIVATARVAGLREFCVAGASLGAPIAIKIAARFPQQVRGLATVVGFARPRATLRLNLELRAALASHGEDILGKFLTSLSFSEEYLAALPPAAVQQITERFAGSPTPGTAAQIAFALGIDVRDDLGAVHVPALIVAATGDRFVSPQHSVEIADGIDHARLVEVTGGHASLFEDPRQTLDALLSFCEDLAELQQW